MLNFQLAHHKKSFPAKEIFLVSYHSKNSWKKMYLSKEPVEPQIGFCSTAEKEVFPKAYDDHWDLEMPIVRQPARNLFLCMLSHYDEWS